MKKYTRFPVNGFLKLPREITNICIWMSSPFDRVRALLDLLMLASFRERTVKLGQYELTIQPGELAYSTVTLARRWKRSRHFVRDVLREFAAIGLIEVRTKEFTTIIRIANWEKYQCAPKKPGQGICPETGQVLGQPPEDTNSFENGLYTQNILLPVDPPGESRDRVQVQPQGEKRATNEEYINNKKKCSSAEASSLAAFLLSEIRKNDPYIGAPDIDKWSGQIERMIECDHISDDVIRGMIAFSQRDPYWNKLIVSPYKLKVHFHKIFLDMKLDEKKKNKIVPSYWRPLI